MMLSITQYRWPPGARNPTNGEELWLSQLAPDVRACVSPASESKSGFGVSD